MDTLFDFLNPFIVFCMTHYWTGAILLFVLCMTVCLILVQLERAQHPKYLPDSDDFFCASVFTLFLTFLWPLIVSIGAVLLAAIIYYYFLGFMVRMILKRTSK